MSALSGRSPRDENRAPASFGIGLTNSSLAVPLVVDETTGELQVSGNGGIITSAYDAISVAYPSTVTEVYSYSYQANPVGTVTVTYTDPTKVYLASVVRS